jgi:beta-glucosidase
MNKEYGIPLEGFVEKSREVASEGMVLLKNNGVLPIVKEDKVSIFGRCQIDFYRSGTGSGGAVNVEYSVNALEGFRFNEFINVNEKLAGHYEEWIKENPFDNGGGGWAMEPWFQKEMPITQEEMNELKDDSNKAIVIIGRTAGEDQDNADVSGGYRLTETERELLKIVNDNFNSFVVVLNVANIIDMNWVNDYENLGAILYSWQGGQIGGHALADVLSGIVNPSGRLTDTIAKMIEDYPTTKNFGNELENYYEEDVYLGYRYFETFHPEKVLFPFGFGLSYTTFEMTTVEVVTDQNVLLKVKVKNTGELSGKEVVQVYLKAPQGLLGKPKYELVAFKKTSELLPNQEEILEIEITRSSFASYDDLGVTGNKSTYIIESGKYEILIGKNVKDLEQAAQIVFEEEILSKHHEILTPNKPYKRMKPGTLNADGTYELIYENIDVSAIDMKERIFDFMKDEIGITGDQGYKLEDVKNEEISLDTFIAQLEPVHLAELVRGEGMSSPKGTPGTAAVFGGVTDELLKFGIPIACCADGPSGIRMDSGHKATQIPIGTLLACTWNTDLVEDLYELEGQELVSNDIDSLLGPGMNIHRHPLNGRNFEYFSEDPLITGKMASACTRGIKKGGSTGTVKHYAANDQESNRHNVDSIVSERALREIHLKGFEMVVKEGEAKSIMTAYNPINGIWAASNYDLNTTILREEWGYTGIVMTDWWAKMNDPINGGDESTQYTNHMIRSQNDIYMVIENNGAVTNANNDNTLKSLEDGSLTIQELQTCAKNILTFILESNAMNRNLSNEIIQLTPHVTDVLSTDEVKNVVEGTFNVGIEKDGEYLIHVAVRSDLSQLAQSSVNILINDTYINNIQTNGTLGLDITKKVGVVKLEKGTYNLEIKPQKPGLSISSMSIEKV